MKNIYTDDDVVKNLTIEAMGKGHYILQIHKMDCNDESHTELLLKNLNPIENAAILDAGCGIGEVARLMNIMRPDLNFTLLNISGAQLALCPPSFKQIQADFHNIPLPDASFDVIMFNYSIGHGTIDCLMAQSRRLLRNNGVVFIYDLEGDDSANINTYLNYNVHSRDNIIAAALNNGLSVETITTPTFTTTEHLKNLLDEKAYNKIFTGLYPIIYKFRKRII